MSLTSSPLTPGISSAFTTLTVAEDTPARKKLFTEEAENAYEPGLEGTKKRIRQMASPLFGKKGDHATDVFPITFSAEEKKPLALFKPGVVNAQKAVLCWQIAQLLGLGNSVPESIEARASLVISKDDLDEEHQPIVYKRVICNNQHWLVNPKDCYLVHTSKKKSLSFKGGYDFTLEPEDDGYKLIPKNNKSDSHPLANEQVRFIMIDDKEHVVKYASAHPIAGDDSQAPYVERGGQRLSLKSSQGPESMSSSDDDYDLFERTGSPQTDDDVLLVGKDVDGLLQSYVDHTPPAVSGRKGARDSFLARIKSCSLIDAVVLSVLFNTEDGKVSLRGDDSNFLFCEGKEGIDLTMIDFDETWPTTNDLKIDGKTASFRLGLLGFNITHEVLSSEENKHFVLRIEAIKNQQMLLADKLRQCQLPESEKVLTAFRERLEKISTFTATGCSLKDFVFHVFPTYGQQFIHLQQAGRAIEQIADYVGYASVDEILQSTR